jgi:hypothetical protein
MTEDTKPYAVPRNLDQDAWFLYQLTAIPYYELCARRCEAFAELFNRFLTGHGLHGFARLDYWVSRYLTHAKNIRRGIGFILDGDDYMPMMGFLNSPASDYRGIVEQPLGWMNEEQTAQWEQSFRCMSGACGDGTAALRNNEWTGLYWRNREHHRHEYQLVDRDDGHKGDLARGIELAVRSGDVTPPAVYPHHPINTSLSVNPGDPCPRSGVWVPSQWLQGAKDFSLAFCVKGRPMQPAFQLFWEYAPIDPEFFSKADESAWKTETRALDTTWHFVDRPAASDSPTAPRRPNVPAGNHCPETGWWFTPAQANSRRYFQAGAIMPAIENSAYGSTYWQWSPDQSAPTL